MSWEPLLDATDSARALDLVRDIAIAIRDMPPMPTPGLSGAAGVALFLSYVESAGVAEGLQAEAALTSSVQNAIRSRLPIGLWTGCAGVRWVITHLAEGEESCAVVEHLDNSVMAALTNAPADISYDVYSGLAGIALAYADDRSVMGNRIIALVIEQLERINWALAKDVAGCAHGIAGVIAALTRCIAAGVLPERARQLLLLLVSYLITVDHRSARVCWCRGEPGIALAVLAAARTLQRPDLEEIAMATALSPFQQPVREWPVDAMLCHGAAGLAHLCNRLYQATGNGLLGERTRDWLRHAMRLHQPGEGVAGFRALRRKPALRWEADPSLLVGAAGVGMALLAGATALPPRWDRLLAADVC